MLTVLTTPKLEFVAVRSESPEFRSTLPITFEPAGSTQSVAGTTERLPAAAFAPMVSGNCGSQRSPLEFARNVITALPEFASEDALSTRTCVAPGGTTATRCIAAPVKLSVDET